MKIRRIAALAVCLLVMAVAPQASAKVYREGDTGDEVAVIQQALMDLEFYYADVTGHYGKRTSAAVRKFQKKYRLDETGQADDETRKKLYLVADVTVEEKAETGADYSVIMRLGSQGSAVRLLQEQLTTLDYYSGAVTGSYGRLTKEAVRLFQRDHDLSSDGVAGPRTMEQIRKELGIEEALDMPANAENEEKKESVVNLETDFSKIGKLNTEWTLRLSSRSGYVKRLQSALSALGYFSDVVDGYFGSKTEEAVKTYQQIRGLTVDGVAGRATLRQINEDMEDKWTMDRAAESVD